MPLSGHRVFADGPADNKVENIRPIPPLGIEVPAEVRESLVQGLASLQQAVEELRKDKHPRVQEFRLSYWTLNSSWVSIQA